jgi:hypothetical protein
MVYRDDWPDLLTGMDITDINPSAATAAARRVRDYLGWHLAPSYTESVTTQGRGWWRLDTIKIITVNSIIDVDNGETVPDVLWEGGRVWSRHSQVTRRVTINFTHGFIACPADVLNFVRDLAKAGQQYRQRSQASIGQVNVSYREPSFANLDGYKLPLIA